MWSNKQFYQREYTTALYNFIKRWTAFFLIQISVWWLITCIQRKGLMLLGLKFFTILNLWKSVDDHKPRLIYTTKEWISVFLYFGRYCTLLIIYPHSNVCRMFQLLLLPVCSLNCLPFGYDSDFVKFFPAGMFTTELLCCTSLWME